MGCLVYCYGSGLGSLLPNLFKSIATLEYANVNLVIAALIWVMIYPMMINVDFTSIKNMGKKPKGLCIMLVVNWLVKPFTMAALGILFFKYIFADFVEPQTAKEYIAGMILLGVAPYTAMVFVWSQLVKGDANYTLVQVSINDIIMVFAFAPIAALLLGVTDIIVPWETLLLSVFLYVVIPLGAGYITRQKLNANYHHEKIEELTAQLKPFSIVGLLATVVGVLVEVPVMLSLVAFAKGTKSYFSKEWLFKKETLSSLSSHKISLRLRPLILLK